MNLNKRANYDLQVAKDYISSEKNPTNDEYFYACQQKQGCFMKVKS